MLEDCEGRFDSLTSQHESLTLAHSLPVLQDNKAGGFKANIPGKSACVCRPIFDMARNTPGGSLGRDLPSCTIMQGLTPVDCMRTQVLMSTQ